MKALPIAALCGFWSFPLSAAEQALPTAQPAKIQLSQVTARQVTDFISEITLGWKSTSRSRKSESQKQVLFNDTTGIASQYFFEAVEDINSAFGYEKLIPQLSTRESPKDQTIMIYLGPIKEGRRILRDVGTSPTKRQHWTGWFWWDEDEGMSKAAIAIHQEEVTAHSLPYYLRRSLLTALGYPGYTSAMNSIFDSYESRVHSIKNLKEDEFITLGDRAVLQFCDRFLSTDANVPSIRKTISREWPAFAIAFDQKASSEKETKSEQNAAAKPLVQ